MKECISCAKRLGLPCGIGAIMAWVMSAALPSSADDRPLGAVRRVEAKFDKIYRETQPISTAAFLKSASKPYEKFDLDVKHAAYRTDVTEKLGLSDEALETLDSMGFVVIPGTPNYRAFGEGHGSIYYDIFEKDLPVFVSSDSILHAWHRSFDSLMQHTEEAVLMPILESLLADTIHALLRSREENWDAVLYLSVALQLLDTGKQWTVPEPVRETADGLVNLIYNENIEEIEFLGMNKRLDFSIFRPRGHYSRTYELQQYFRAMTWLLQFGLVLHNGDGNSYPRQEAAARQIVRALDVAKGWDRMKRIDTYYTTLVGKSTDPSPLALKALCAQAGLPLCEGNADRLRNSYEALLQAEQLNLNEEGEPSLTLNFFAQKFGYTSWMTARTTAPRMKPFPVSDGRTMASVFDVAYALGADRAATYLTEDMQRPNRQNLPRTLTALRKTVQLILPTALGETPYNHWMEALMSAAEPTLGRRFPKVMRTAAWHDKRLETVLSSWTEMRHDTILVIRGWGASGCSYPSVYVDPLPGIYRALAKAAQVLKRLYVNYSHPDLGDVNSWFAHFVETMTHLEKIAETELSGRAPDAEASAYINTMMKMERDDYTGERLYDGWYPQLYWRPNFALDDFSDKSGRDDPITADVFTDYEHDTVLQTAVGHPGIVVVGIKTGKHKLTLYAGPVSSFYSFETASEERLTDDVWQERLSTGSVPDRPAFSAPYWVE